MADTTDDRLADLYRSARTIAVVGASADESKPAHRIPAYLQSQGYRIIPVNPGSDQVLGEQAEDSLTDIAEPVDVVDVFRPSEEAPDVAREAVAIGAKVLWLQQGIESEEAADIARAGGLAVVMDTCMGATHRRLTDAGTL